MNDRWIACKREIFEEIFINWLGYGVDGRTDIDKSHKLFSATFLNFFEPHWLSAFECEGFILDKKM